MSKTVDLQIRKLPARLRDRLRQRARSKGMTMSGYLIDLMERDFDRPTMDEWLEEVASMPDVQLPPDFSAAALIREVREEREKELGDRIERSLARRPEAGG